MVPHQQPTTHMMGILQSQMTTKTAMVNKKMRHLIAGTLKRVVFIITILMLAGGS